MRLCSLSVLVLAAGSVVDEHNACPAWAAAGECSRNPVFMLESCRVSTVHSGFTSCR